MKLHLKFRELRKERGWSQEYVADQIIVSPKTISSWECGRTQMDTDAVEALSKLYGYELQPEEKKEMNVGFISIHDIADHPHMSFSARDIIGQRKVTLRVDIPQKLKREIRDIAEADESILDDIVEKALAHYVLHLKEQDILPKEDGLYHLESSYYEKEMAFSKREARILIGIYKEIAGKQGFKPEISTIYDIVEDKAKLDTVLYHVEEFGKDHENFEYIQHLFDEEGTSQLKLYQKINHWAIKEKPLDQVPIQYEETQRFVIFSPDGKCMEDNLTLEQATEWAKQNTDYVEE
jgi:transcriptional regulator with XRE-family HTH domain